MRRGQDKRFGVPKISETRTHSAAVSFTFWPDGLAETRDIQHILSYVIHSATHTHTHNMCTNNVAAVVPCYA